MKLGMSKSVPVMMVLALFIILGAIGRPGICAGVEPSPTHYFVTIEKLANPESLTLAVGESSNINYTIRLTVHSDEPTTAPCYLTLESGECIKVTDTGYPGTVPVGWKVCYTDGPGTYDFTYPKQVGPFPECGDYFAYNDACMEYNPTPTPPPLCCADVLVSIDVPCAGDDGCTPGYWKNHLDSWPPSGYTPADDFDTTFGVDLFDPDITLEEAVWARGGGVKKLARHGTAALLSAAHPDVDYPLSVAQVIAAVQAGDADTLVSYNELGCPLD